MKLTFISAALVATFMSFSTGKEVTTDMAPQETVTQSGNAANSFYIRKWYLTKIYESEGAREVAEKKAFIRFNWEQGSAGGNGGCNSFGSSLKVNDKSISIEDIFSTKMYCDDIQSVEDSFFSQLDRANRYEIKGNTLLLYSGDKVILEFEGE